MPYFSGPNGIREVADPGERFLQSFQDSRRKRLLSDYFSSGQTDLGQLARLDPEAAQQIQAQQKQQGLAKMFADLYVAPEAERPKGIAALLGADLQTGQQAMKTFDPRFATGNESPADVRSFEYFADGLTPEQRKQAQLEKLGLGPQKQANAQYVDVPDGMGGMVKMVFDPQTRQFSKPQYPGNGQQAPQQDVQGNPIAIKYDGPPEERAAFDQLVAADSGQQFAPGQYSATLPPQVVQSRGGGMGYEPPKTQEQVKMLSPQEVVAAGLPTGTVAQRKPDGSISILSRPDAAQGGQNPLPVAAMRADQDIQDALNANKLSADIIAKHAARLKNGELQVSPVKAAGAGVRGFLGNANENDVNLTELRSDLTKYVNEALRLNKGVQTEGDAQRAMKEIMSSNDPTIIARALERLAVFSKQAAEAAVRKRRLLYSNYGRTIGQGQAPAKPASGGARTITRNGTQNGRKVVQYSDGSVEYAD